MAPGGEGEALASRLGQKLAKRLKCSEAGGKCSALPFDKGDDVSFDIG